MSETVEIKVSELMKRCTLTVTVTGARRAELRLKVCCLLLRIAAAAGGVGLAVEVKG